MTKDHPLALYRQSRDPPMSISDLAKMLGVARNTVWRWEDGRLPEKGKWSVIEAKTGVRVEDLARFTAEAAE
jgi:predicted transcriptional regulator